MTSNTIALVGTLDTKGEELAYLRDLVESQGLRSLTVDVGILGDPLFTPDITRGSVAAAAKENLATLVERRIVGIA